MTPIVAGPNPFAALQLTAYPHMGRVLNKGDDPRLRGGFWSFRNQPTPVALALWSVDLSLRVTSGLMHPSARVSPIVGP